MGLITKKRLRKLEIKERELESLKRLLKNNGYVMLDPLEKIVVLSALEHWHFMIAAVGQQNKLTGPLKTRYINPKIYKAVVEKFKKEVRI